MISPLEYKEILEIVKQENGGSGRSPTHERNPISSRETPG
jgi:hypothetical protein